MPVLRASSAAPRSRFKNRREIGVMMQEGVTRSRAHRPGGELLPGCTPNQNFKYFWLEFTQGFLRESEFASARRDNRVHFTPPGGGHSFKRCQSVDLLRTEKAECCHNEAEF